MRLFKLSLVASLGVGRIFSINPTLLKSQNWFTGRSPLGYLYTSLPRHQTADYYSFTSWFPCNAVIPIWWELKCKRSSTLDFIEFAMKIESKNQWQDVREGWALQNRNLHQFSNSFLTIPSFIYNRQRMYSRKIPLTEIYPSNRTPTPATQMLII